MSELPETPIRPSARTAGRWIAQPAEWGDDRPSVRARAIARRTQISARSLARRDRPLPAPRGEPAGWLVPAGPGTRALFEAAHPVTGDQLLSTDPEEACRLGYGECRLLGHVVAAAPLTGVLGFTSLDLGWTTRVPGHSQRGLGTIERPLPGAVVSRQSFEVNGVALFPPGLTSRVEIELDGKPAGRARLGVPRDDPATAREYKGADVVLAGFQHHATAAHLGPEATEVRIDAIVQRLDGERFTLPSRVVALEPARSEPSDPGGRAAGLRRRVAKQIAEAPRRERPGLAVLVFAHQLDVGGAQRYLFELLEGLIDDPDVTCEVVAPETGVYEAAIEALGIPVHTSPGLGPGEGDAYEGRMLELAAWAAGQGFDLVLANTVDAFPGADLATRLGLPVIWSLHESFDLAHWWAARFRTEDAFPYARERVEIALREADTLVFAADATRHLYEPYAAPERMLTLPYGVELAEIDAYRARFDRSAARRRLGIGEDTTVLLSLGRLEPRKGQALIAQAFATLAEDHPDALLVIVGDQPGPYSDALHEYVRRAGLEDRVRLEPISPDPYAWHAIADLFVLASDIESSPIVVLEALAFETPVVATAVFGVPETIEDGVSGYLCESSDLSSLTTTLSRALEADEDERSEVGETGGRRVRERHGAQRYVRDIRSLMNDLAAGGQPRGRPPRSAPTRVSVLIPTLNAGPGFERSLEMLLAQEGLGELEILVTDSGSEDETVALAHRAGATVETVPASQFNHGADAGRPRRACERRCPLDHGSGRHADRPHRPARAGGDARGRRLAGGGLGLHHSGARGRPVQPVGGLAAATVPCGQRGREQRLRRSPACGLGAGALPRARVR